MELIRRSINYISKNTRGLSWILERSGRLKNEGFSEAADQKSKYRGLAGTSMCACTFLKEVDEHRDAQLQMKVLQ